MKTGRSNLTERVMLLATTSMMEGKMTDAQRDRRETIVKGMKKNASEFKKKYGSDWKSVMYATATKASLKENWDYYVDVEFDDYDDIGVDYNDEYFDEDDYLDSPDGYLPTNEGEKNFWDKHSVEVLDYPVDAEAQFKGFVVKQPRLADYADGKDKYVYEETGIRKYSKIISEVLDRRNSKSISEEFVVGGMKLKDGNTVQISKENAYLLNTLYNTLNEDNKAKLMEKASADKESFAKVIAFAKDTVGDGNNAKS